jgi:hypothetical protein
MTSLNEQQFSVKKLMNMESSDAQFYQTYHESDTGAPLPQQYRKYPSRIYQPPVQQPGSEPDNPQDYNDHLRAVNQRPVEKNITRVRDVAKYKLAQSKGEEPGGTEVQSAGYRHLYAHMAEMGERAHGLPPVEVTAGTVRQGHHRIAIANELGWHSLPVEGH